MSIAFWNDLTASLQFLGLHVFPAELVLDARAFAVAGCLGERCDGRGTDRTMARLMSVSGPHVSAPRKKKSPASPVGSRGGCYPTRKFKTRT